MKQYNKTHLPELIENSTGIYKIDIELTHRFRDGLKIKGSEHIQVNVLNNTLKGKTDLHGQAYKPTRWIYSKQS